MTYCSHCGAALPAGARVCGICHAPVVQSVQLVPPPHGRSRRQTWLILAACVLVLMGVGEFGRTNASLFSAAPAVPSGHTVVYTVSSTTNLNRASFTWSTADGSTQQYDATKLPWQRSYRMASGAFAYISAQNAEKYGDVTCAIIVDGVEVKTAQSIGGYVIASCSGRVP